MSSEFDQENLLRIFVAEASDGMNALAAALQSSDNKLPPPHQIQEQFITAHRIKGASALYGYSGIAHLCERIEALCEHAMTVDRGAWPQVVAVMRELVQGVQDLLLEIRSSGTEDSALVERYAASASNLLPDQLTTAGMLMPAQMCELTYVAPALDASALTYFVPEAEEYLSVMAGVILTLRTGPVRKDALPFLCRTAHALNMAASAVGYYVIRDLAQKMEECVRAAQDGRILSEVELLDVLDLALSLIRMLLRRDMAVTWRLRSDVPALYTRLDQLCRNGAIDKRLGSALPATSAVDGQGAAISDVPVSCMSACLQSEGDSGEKSGGAESHNCVNVPEAAMASPAHASEEGMTGAMYVEPASVQDEPTFSQPELESAACTNAQVSSLPVIGDMGDHHPSSAVSEPAVPAMCSACIWPVLDEAALSHCMVEAEELLVEMEGLIQILCLDSTGDAIRSFMRAIRRLKDIAGSVGAQAIGDITLKIDECLVAVLAQRISVSSSFLDAAVHAMMLIRLILQRDATAGEALATDIPGLLRTLSQLCEHSVSAQVPSQIAETAGPSWDNHGSVTSAEYTQIDRIGECADGTLDLTGVNEAPREALCFDVGTSGASEAGDGIGPIHPAEQSSETMACYSDVDAAGAFSMERVSDSAVPALGLEYIIPVIDDEVLSYFVPEAEEYLVIIEELIPVLRIAPNNEDALYRLFRAIHTLKGSAYTVDFQVIGDIAHPMEDCMVAARDHRLLLSNAMLDAFALAVSTIRRLLQRDTLGGKSLQHDAGSLLEMLRHACKERDSGESSTAAPAPCLQVEETPSITRIISPEQGVEDAQLPHVLDDYFLPELDPDVMSYFVPEAEEYLETLEANLLRLDKDPQNRDLINQLFRTAHTLKGSAYTVGFQAIGDLIHHVEDFMGAVRENRLCVIPGHTDRILRAVDIVHVLIRRKSNVLENTKERFQTSLSELKQLTQEDAVNAVAKDQSHGEMVKQWEQKPYLEEDEGRGSKQVESRTGEEREVIRVSHARLERLMNLVGELVIGRGRLEQRLRMLERLSDQVLACKTRMIDSVQSFSEKHTFTFQSAPDSPDFTPMSHGTKEFSDFGTLELDKYDDFNILARRIGEVSADITEAMAQLSGSIGRAQEDMNALQQLTRIMRDEIGRARMVPVGTPFTRFRRAIREIAKSLDKQVALATSGEHTEVDTGIVEGLVDPLIHLIRNAVYHGIEPPADRVAKGKPAAGTIYLHAAHRGNAIVIEVEDDGGGLNLVKIREKAVASGLMSGEQIQVVPDNEVLQCIFVPGFSTAETVGNQAGRGVGLDVVKRAIEGMNGHIEVESEPGVGTKFTLSLPLTLLITTALLVRSGGERYAIALTNIREVVLPAAMSLEHLEDRTLLRMNEEVIEVQSLRQLLHRAPHPVTGDMPVVIVKTAWGGLGLAVDELLGRQEIVIKTLGALKPLTNSCFAGATIDPEGQVVLVIDPSRFEMRHQMRVSKWPEPLFQSALLGNSANELSEDSRAGILLIDDSLSIRKFVGRMLESAGYPVDTAVDGDDGIKKATEKAYRLVITDLEMPKFNGYEVIQALRSRSQTHQTPIVVMTTRAGDKHRQLACDIGANSYIAKPIDERTLLNEVERWVGTASARQL